MLALVGGTVADVYTGTWIKANVEIEDVSAVDIESVRAPKRLEHTAPSTDE